MAKNTVYLVYENRIERRTNQIRNGNYKECVVNSESWEWNVPTEYRTKKEALKHFNNSIYVSKFRCGKLEYCNIEFCVMEKVFVDEDGEIVGQDYGLEYSCGRVKGDV